MKTQELVRRLWAMSPDLIGNEAAAKIESLMSVNAELLEALNDLVKIIESAGVANLTRGVELGQTVWFVKMSDGLEYANKVIQKATS